MDNAARNWLLAAAIALLAACGGGGGGDRAEGVDPGQPPVTPPPVIPPPVVPPPGDAPYVEQTVLVPAITAVTLDEANRPLVQFQLANGEGAAIVDLEQVNIRFTAAKLQASPLGAGTGSWQSYVNRIETAGSVGPGTEDRLQATYERDGEFTNNGDGTYQYRFLTALDALPEDILAQADTEGLDLGYDAALTHRVAIQFDGAPGKANPFYDWVPATGAAGSVFNMHIAATESCNSCHDPLAIHGGGRIEMEYCVTCHNPGSTDANSGNSVDMKVMVHKIHAGANLPSVQAGGQYVIWGFRDGEHDYSMLHYPRDLRDCTVCHAGPTTGSEGQVITPQGDNWAQYPSGAACGSCHDNAFGHIDRFDDADCASCHSAGGAAGAVADSHLNPVTEASKLFAATITDISNTAPGQQPMVSFRISNPETGEDYDLKNDPVFAPFSVRVGVAWDTRDFTNTGNGGDNASNVQVDAILASTPNGDGSYTVTLPIAIPDGSAAPGVAASGSGAATIEGHPAMDVDGDGEPDNIPLDNVSAFFSIDEASGQPVARRQRVALEQCLACHGDLVLHGANRNNDIDGCVTCHNPRNTDKRVREVAMDPPTDGKDEESIDFKVMIHGIHAAAVRENPLEIVGFRGFTTHRYTEEQVHYPGNIANCTTCHTDGSIDLPLAEGVLGTTIDTGADRADPADDVVVTPVSAVCASCHDSQLATAHMSSNGGSFATSQQAIDNGEVVEQCELCHASGRNADLYKAHGID